MSRDRERLSMLAARLAAIGARIAVVAGVAQVTIGNRIPEWSGNKDQPVALGLLTIALGVSILLAARLLRAETAPSDERITGIALWLALVAVLCSTTVGRLWVIPGSLITAAACVTLAACGWHRFRSVVASHWLRGLLGMLGAFELLMAVSAASAVTKAAGLAAGAALIAAAILTRSGSRTMIALLVAATVPFAALTWWTVVTPLLTVVALSLGLVTAAGDVRPDRVVLDQPSAW